MRLPLSREKCSFCGLEATAFNARHQDAIRLECKRCGNYEIDGALFLTGQHNEIPEAERDLFQFLPAYVLRCNREGSDPHLSMENWRALAEMHAHTPPAEKSRKLLVLLAERSYPGREAPLDLSVDAPLIDAIDAREVRYYLKDLVEKGLVGESITHGGGHTVKLAGWQALGHSPGGITGRCFVAMSFDTDLLPAWEEGIRPALTVDCHLDPYRVDRDEHNDKIDDRIIVEIRRAEFLVADVTGHRQGVYFEAGYAMGLSRPVIWTCRDDALSGAHFDTRQYNHVVWSTPADLREKLANRVRATIPTAQARLTRATEQ